MSDIYRGEVKDGKFHGEGILILSDIARFEGTFENGYKTKGIYTFSNGNIYEGSYIKDRSIRHIDGEGIIKYANGDYYEGEFQNGIPHGQGKFIGNDGSSYEGGFSLGTRACYGKSYMEGRLIYDGQYQNGLYCGRGELHKYGVYTLTAGFYQGKPGDGTFKDKTGGEMEIITSGIGVGIGIIHKKIIKPLSLQAQILIKLEYELGLNIDSLIKMKLLPAIY